MDTPPPSLQSPPQSPIIFQLVKASQPFASRCACVMFGLSVTATLELLQCAMRFLFLLLPLTPPPTCAMLHAFIHPSPDNTVCVENKRPNVWESTLLRACPSMWCHASLKNCHLVSMLQMRSRLPCCHDSLLQKLYLLTYTQTHHSFFFSVLYINVSFYKINI